MLKSLSAIMPKLYDHDSGFGKAENFLIFITFVPKIAIMAQFTWIGTGSDLITNS
jgi:hypothetical protein